MKRLPFVLVATAPLLLGFQEKASAVVLSATQSDFCNTTTGFCDGTTPFTLSAGPGPAPGSDGLFTLSAFGDFASLPEESFNVNIEGYNLGDWLNNNLGDDSLDGPPDDAGSQYSSTLVGTNTIPKSILAAILSDGVVQVTFTPLSTEIDDLGSGEFISFDLEYQPAASVPGPLPVFGAAAAFGYSRKLRKRIKDSKLPAAID